MADEIGLAAIGCDQHHPHHPARRRSDILLFGMGRCWRKQRDQQGEAAEEGDHERAYILDGGRGAIGKCRNVLKARRGKHGQAPATIP